MTPMESYFDNSSNNFKALSGSTNDENAKLETIQNLKKYFQPPEKILGNIKLMSLLQEGGILLKNKTHEKDFLITYGRGLLNYFGKDKFLDHELLSQLEIIFSELQQEAESLAEKLFTKVIQLQSGSFLNFNSIMEISKHIFEKRVLDAIENNCNSDFDFLAKMSANSPKLFQTVSSILYLLMVKTLGHWRIFEVTASFICLVLSVCKKNGKDFLGLYPKNCRRIVSFLMVSPDFFFDKHMKNEVLELVTEMFLLDRKKILVLLSHYPDWLYVFRNHLIKSA